LATAGFAAAASPAAAPISAVNGASVASGADVPQALAVNAAPSVRISSRFIVVLLWGGRLQGRAVVIAMVAA
jgi:hypothetical protein